jgi:hypothetical protein
MVIVQFDRLCLEETEGTGELGDWETWGNKKYLFPSFLYKKIESLERKLIMVRYKTHFEQKNSKNNNNERPKILPLVKQIAIASLISAVAFYYLGKFLPFDRAAKTSSQSVYVAYQTNSIEATKLAAYVNYDLSRILQPEQLLNIDLLSGNGIKNIYSLASASSEIRKLHQYFDRPVASSDAALLKAVKRVRDLAEKKKAGDRLDVLLVGEGTSDRDTIDSIQNITQEMVEKKLTNVRIHLVGLSPNNKIPTSAAFNPIRSSIAGSCTNEYSQCRSSIDNLAP